MQWRLPTVFLGLFLLAGCAPKHYTAIEGDSLVLYFFNREAKEVLFASSTDDFQLHAAKRSSDHLWKVVLPVSQNFRYFYKVDGKLVIPDCQYKESDDFGSQNCVFQKKYVTPATTSRY